MKHRFFRQIYFCWKLLRVISMRNGQSTGDKFSPKFAGLSLAVARGFGSSDFVGFIRVRLLEMPLERDEGEYAYAGQLLLQGIPPYELAYNMKLPGTYFAYAAGMAVFGQTIGGNPPDAAGGKCADNHLCLFAGAKTFWQNGRSRHVRELWNNVSKSGGFRDGGARNTIRCFICRASHIDVVERHRVK